MKKLMIGLCLLFSMGMVQAQELFAYTEPASNMATKSVGLRMNNYLMNLPNTSQKNYLLIPEIMVGVSKKLMVHSDVFMSNQNQSGLGLDGGSVYAKYRFYSNDDVQKHFRMAAFGRIAMNNLPIVQEDISLYGQNSGFDAGIVATQLLHKLAISSSISFEYATNNMGDYKFPVSQNATATNYTFSVGKLVLPKRYTTFKQTNMNLMLEILGQTNLGNGRSYLDVAPVAQFIFNSKTRVDIGYRQQLYSSLVRSMNNGILLRIEYNLFNAF
jgi:hypothetical protein